MHCDMLHCQPSRCQRLSQASGICSQVAGCACRLQDAEAQLLVSIFLDFWAAQKDSSEQAAISGPAAETASEAATASPSTTLVDSSQGVKSLAADNGRKASQVDQLNEQLNHTAINSDKDVSSRNLGTEGGFGALTPDFAMSAAVRRTTVLLSCRFE